MDLHRPLDLNKINDDFFSGNPLFGAEKIPSDAELEGDLWANNEEIINSVFASIEKNKKVSPDLSLDELKKMLGNLEVRKNGALNDLPDEKTAQENADANFQKFELGDLDLVSEAPKKKAGKKAEKTAEKKFDKETLKREKENAEKKIDEEKKRIKSQKKLERKVQKPFRKRRLSIALFIFILLIDMLVASFSFLVSKIDTNYLEPMELFGYNVSFVDSSIIQSDEYANTIILFKNTLVQGNQDILFLSKPSEVMIGEVIAIGDDLYAVDLKTRVTKVGADSILGVIDFSIPNVGNILTFIRANADHVLLACIIFAAIALFVFSLRIVFLNKKIKRLKESYELI